MLTRRQVLTTATTLPAVVASLSAAGCAAPNPLDVALGRRPPLSGDVRALLAAVTVEQDLIDRYDKALAAHSALAASLRPLQAEHRDHLSRLQAQISYPKGYVATPSPGGRTSAGTVPASKNAAIAALRSAESSAAAAQLTRLMAVGPSSAQLLASIAAAEITHVDALAGTA